MRHVVETSLVRSHDYQNKAYQISLISFILLTQLLIDVFKSRKGNKSKKMKSFVEWRTYANVFISNTKYFDSTVRIVIQWKKGTKERGGIL